MDFINLLSSTSWPTGNFWSALIKIFDVGIYAWTIILFTIVLKLVLSPLDFTQRFYANKTSRAQAKLQPQLEKLKRQYGQNQNLLYQKQNELYQKNGVSSRGSCIFMLVYLVLTFVIFITLFNSMQYIARYKIQDQYNQLQSTYYTTFNSEYVSDYLGVDITSNETKIYTEEELEGYVSAKITEIETEQSLSKEEATVAFENEKAKFILNAQEDVVEKYAEIKDSWLWINNIWVADKATQKAILNYDSFVNSTQNKGVDKEVYQTVMGKLLAEDSEYNVANGYYILSIIVILVSFLSQFIMRKSSQPKTADGKTVETPNSSKIMMFLMPLIMVMFTLNSSAIFSIYIITNSVMSTLLVPITMKICNAIEKKNEEKEYNKTKVDYRR